MPPKWGYICASVKASLGTPPPAPFHFPAGSDIGNGASAAKINSSGNPFLGFANGQSAAKINSSGNPFLGFANGQSAAKINSSGNPSQGFANVAVEEVVKFFSSAVIKVRTSVASSCYVGELLKVSKMTFPPVHRWYHVGMESGPSRQLPLI